jgi:hypothetical protein
LLACWKLERSAGIGKEGQFPGIRVPGFLGCWDVEDMGSLGCSDGVVRKQKWLGDLFFGCWKLDPELGIRGSVPSAYGGLDVGGGLVEDWWTEV